jgi:hypothetical protein
MKKWSCRLERLWVMSIDCWISPALWCRCRGRYILTFDFAIKQQTNKNLNHTKYIEKQRERKSWIENVLDNNFWEQWATLLKFDVIQWRHDLVEEGHEQNWQGRSRLPLFWPEVLCFSIRSWFCFSNFGSMKWKENRGKWGEEVECIPVPSLIRCNFQQFDPFTQLKT